MRQLRGLLDQRVGGDRVTSDAIGVRGVLAQRGFRAHAARVPGSAVGYGFRWKLRDGYTQRWWPQGISLGEHEGIPLAIVSWFEKPRSGAQPGSRITLVDLRDRRRPRYHHVGLVLPRREETGTHFDPLPIHAGGIAWAGDRLLVAATFAGIHEFRLSGILAGNLLPTVAHHRPLQQTGERLRYSFLSLAAEDTAELHLVAGEYGDGPGHRLATVTITDAGSSLRDSHVPGIPHMQGAVQRDGHWFVTSSRGDRLGGDLWTGTPGEMTRHDGVLPPGPEDLALGLSGDELWSLSEFPGRRWVFAISPERL